MPPSERMNTNFYNNMDGTGGDYAEWNKSSRESQLSYGFTYLWGIRNNMKDTRRGKGKVRGEIGGGNKPWETMDSKKQTEGLEGKGEPISGY